jgi:rod shape-determining protein MreC
MFAGSKVFSELGNLILFLLLEGISFYLIITFNDSQAKIYHNTVNVISGNVANQSSNIRGYFSLKEQNNILLKENAKLKSKLFNLAEKQGAKPEDLDLKVTQNQIFNLVSARVVNNSISLRNNFLSLNKGRKAGITENQGVIGENGFIGVS